MTKSTVTPAPAARSSASPNGSPEASRRHRNRLGGKQAAWALSTVTAVVLVVGLLAVQRFSRPGGAPVHEEPGATIQQAFHTTPAPLVLRPEGSRANPAPGILR